AAIVALSSIENPNVSITSNTCEPNLPSRKNCVIKIKYVVDLAESISNENLLKIANNQLTYSVIASNPTVAEPEVIAIVPAEPSVSVALDQPQNQSGSIVYTNTGTMPLAAPVSAV